MKLFKPKKDKSPDRQRQSSSLRSANRVNSYYTASKKQIDTFERTHQTQGLQQHPRSVKGWAIKIGISLLALLAVGGLLTLSGGVNVTVQSGEAYRSIDTYQAIAADVIHNDFRNKIKFTLQADAIEAALAKAIPEASTVEVYAPLFGREPEVLLTIPEPFAILSQEASEQYIVNIKGKIALPAQDYLPSTDQLSTISNTSGIVFALADQLFKPDEMVSMRELQYQYAKGESGVAVPYVLPAAPREIYVIENSYVAKFSLGGDEPIQQQFGALRAVQGKIAGGQTAQPSEYIDVRLASKIFIK